MKDLLKAARGDIPCELVIRGGKIANVLSLEYERADVAVHRGIIVGVGRDYDGVENVDATGKVLLPGMIDGHMHIESTMLSPKAFADAVLPLGTTTIMPDPHEIANTCGMSGVEYMWREGLRTPLDMFFGAPSCVPASPYETPLEEIDANDLALLFDRGWCTHLGEMMNYPGVIRGDGDVWAKITAARHLVKTGHLPGVSGKDLCAYMISGCNGDHECETADEAKEKLRRGSWLMLREGATAHNMREMARVIQEDESRHARCMVVSDDLTAGYILRNGHMDHKVRELISLGFRPLIALALVTINPATYFRLWDRGAIAPGMIADIVMANSLEECRPLKVWKRGVLVAQEGRPCYTADPETPFTAPAAKPIPVSISAASLLVRSATDTPIRVIETVKDSVLTKHLIIDPTEREGYVVSDPSRDIAKMVVVEKNQGTGRKAIGFVMGMGVKSGAIASSVAHDAHNFVAIGVDDESIAAALRHLAEMGGGLVTAESGRVAESFALPIGGLMSDCGPEETAAGLERMERAATALGITLPHPFMTMGFLSLSVIPELKLTDLGYVDLGRGGAQDLFA